MAIFAQTAHNYLLSLMSATALLKVAFFFMAWTTFWFPLAIPIAILLKWHPSKPLAAEQKLPLLASLYLIAPLIVWGATWVEGVSFSEYGLTWKLSLFISLGGGFILGVMSLAIAFFCQWLLGWIEWQSVNLASLGTLGLSILMLALWIAITEELVFRGFLVNELQQDYSIGVTAIISSLIFALLHLIWEQENTLPQLPGLWLMGMVLVLARYVDGGSLGLPWGLHAGWIWGLTCLQEGKLISYTGKAATWITGLQGNPLAGMVGFLCLLAVGGLLFMIAIAPNLFVETIPL
ncbi:MAG TPA: CPBP family intramembrane metalloprotease domain-containing protein [Cyanobacteria bacterium UBA11370]|nr:CPBP family intramembrane metalloprotease domain-containing protein [Cyanobacteria bacterium UBA11370]HBY78708.1 CPBP family intramembrane metalloprotease domain-containing protein [Cyanobacteria bacterium UBA11148]